MYTIPSQQATQKIDLFFLQPTCLTELHHLPGPVSTWRSNTLPALPTSPPPECSGLSLFPSCSLSASFRLVPAFGSVPDHVVLFLPSGPEMGVSFWPDFGLLKDVARALLPLVWGAPAGPQRLATALDWGSCGSPKEEEHCSRLSVASDNNTSQIDFHGRGCPTHTNETGSL